MKILICSVLCTAAAKLPSFNSHIEVDELFWNKLKLQNGMISIVQQHHNTDVTAKFKSFYQGTLTSALHVYNDHAAMQTVVKNSQLSPMLIDLGIAPEPTSGSINLVRKVIVMAELTVSWLIMRTAVYLSNSTTVI